MGFRQEFRQYQMFEVKQNATTMHEDIKGKIGILEELSNDGTYAKVYISSHGFYWLRIDTNLVPWPEAETTNPAESSQSSPITAPAKTYHKSMIRTAYVWAEESYCKRKKVGAVLTKNGEILKEGYNGTIKGFRTNDCEENGVTTEFVIHAEANLLDSCTRLGIPTDGCDMYITLEPCIECAKRIANCGIKNVYYHESYRCHKGIEYLKKVGVNVEKIIIPNNELSLEIGKKDHEQDYSQGCS